MKFFLKHEFFSSALFTSWDLLGLRSLRLATRTRFFRGWLGTGTSAPEKWSPASQPSLTKFKKHLEARRHMVWPMWSRTRIWTPWSLRVPSNSECSMIPQAGEMARMAITCHLQLSPQEYPIQVFFHHCESNSFILSCQCKADGRRKQVTSWSSHPFLQEVFDYSLHSSYSGYLPSSTLLQPEDC